MTKTITRLAGILLILAVPAILVLSAERTAARAPTAPPQDLSQSYAQRATWFIDRTLEGQYAAALQIGSERFKRDIGEKGLRHFRDTMSKYGKGTFRPECRREPRKGISSWRDALNSPAAGRWKCTSSSRATGSSTSTSAGRSPRERTGQ